MGNPKKDIFTVVIAALVFTLLFHRQDLGLNIFLMEMGIVTWLYRCRQIDFKIVNHLIFTLGLLLSAVAVIAVYSIYAIVVNLLALFIFTGILIYPRAKSLVTTLNLSFWNLPGAQRRFFKGLFEVSVENGKKSKLKKLAVFIIPMLIIIFFVGIYSGSSPFFSRLLDRIATFFNDSIFSVFVDVDVLAVFTFIVGLMISNVVFLGVSRHTVVQMDVNASDELLRTKKKRHVAPKFSALTDEYKAGIFLLIALNAVLLVVNVLDIYWVWFNFAWNGEYLKQFVHEGTYLLLLSIICSIIIVLYFFRGNLNFYQGNGLLRKLCYVWLAQNALLTLSVGVRNLHYIDYFALAYKRIALLFFLLLTLYGLYTVIVKVSRRKSPFYLFRKNVFALYVVLVVSAAINWETCIAKYNFSDASAAFIELRYLAQFPDKVLPYLNKSDLEMARVKAVQKDLFPPEKLDLTQAEYQKIIGDRKTRFLKKYESRNILSWNWPEYCAYRDLK